MGKGAKKKTTFHSTVNPLFQEKTIVHQEPCLDKPGPDENDSISGILGSAVADFKTYILYKLSSTSPAFLMPDQPCVVAVETEGGS